MSIIFECEVDGEDCVAAKVSLTGEDIERLWCILRLASEHVVLKPEEHALANLVTEKIGGDRR